MNMKVKFVLAMMAGFACAAAAYFLIMSVSSDSAQKDLEKWLEQNKNGYDLNIKEAIWQQKEQFLTLDWRGMKIELTFDTLVQSIVWQKDSLQNHLQAYNVYDIYNRLPNNGWNMQPVVGKSLAQGLSIEQIEDQQLAIQIQTDIIAMEAKNESKACIEKPEETCSIFIQTKLPFQIKTELLKVETITMPSDKTTNIAE